jgi:hypothetical protein
MAGDNARVGVHQNRVVEAKFGDTGGYLRDLFLRMRTGILRIPPVEWSLLASEAD